MPRSSPPPRLSAKKHKALKGKKVYSTIKKRGGKPKPNPKRRKKTIEDANGPVERRQWMKLQPCCVPSCGIVGYSDGAHIVNGGMGKKAHYTKTIPLCGRALDLVFVGVLSHHTELDAGNGRKAFAKKYGIDLAEEARKTEERWQAFSTTAGTDV